MRSASWVVAGLVCCGASAKVIGQQFTADIGPDWRTRPVLVMVTNGQNTVSCQTNIVVELSGGMNRWDEASGQWIAAEPKLISTDEGGALGKGARHSVHFAPNINSGLSFDSVNA